MKDVIGSILEAARRDGDYVTRALLPDYVHTQAAAEVFDRLMLAACSLIDTRGAAEEAIAAPLAELCDAFEHQGFINGFRYGLQLAKELAPDYAPQGGIYD